MNSFPFCVTNDCSVSHWYIYINRGFLQFFSFLSLMIVRLVTGIYINQGLFEYIIVPFMEVIRRNFVSRCLVSSRYHHPSKHFYEA